MAEQYATGWCYECDQKRRLSRPGTNHLLHFFLGLFTCGLWWLIWPLVAIQFGGWRCTHCGAKCWRSLYD